MIGADETSPLPRRPWVPPRIAALVTLRRVRLGTGLVLFAYVVMHLLNHAVGNLSVRAMEDVLDVVAGLWSLPPLAGLLYGSLLVHMGLGIWAIYARPRFEWSLAESLQLASGLALPALLASHVVGTKIASTLYAERLTYATQLHFFVVVSPWPGLRQAVALVAAWAHGCLGVWQWLRLKPWFRRAAPLLLAAAVLLPTVSLLGFLHAGRDVADLARDPAWRAANLAPADMASPEIAARLARLQRIETTILALSAAAVLLALAGRAVRHGAARRRGLVRVTYPDGRVGQILRGTTVLEASRILKVPHAAICGGRGRCSTCRVRVFGEGGRLPEPSLAERAVLDRVAAGPQVRLACQLRPESDIRVAPLIPPAAAFAEARRQAQGAGEERVVVAFFVDMRGSTRLAEERLPFDTVFLINRFLEAVARAVDREGGQPNQFLGDGMMALFGLSTPPEDAARAALAAVAGVGREIAALNEMLRHDMPEPIRFGIGVAAGTAVLGEIGGHASGHRVYTAIGDPVNVAARLQGLTKRHGVEALVAASVYAAAGTPPPNAAEAVALDGRDAPIEAHPIPRTIAIA